MGADKSAIPENVLRLVDEIRNRKIRAVSRAISLIEDDPAFAPLFVRAISPFYEKKPRLGITGSPGVGKSTLAKGILRILRSQSLRVGVVAVDPTSPFTGGAVLGDRIRMVGGEDDDEGVYIRSMGSRGSLGGISSATANAVRVLELYGSDIVIVETVGIGQTGFDVVEIADCVVLLLSPESGDGIQTMKAGVMEIADIYVINKADRPGADGLFTEVSLLLSSVDERLEWKPPVKKVCATTGEGVAEVLESFYAHQQFLKDKGLLKERMRQQVVSELRFLIEERVRRKLSFTPGVSGKLKNYAEMVYRGEIDTYSAVEAIIGELADNLKKS